MKKIAGIILAAALFAIPVYAADIDIASLSDEELQEVQTDISEELSDRASETSEVLTGGDYTGGKDIKAGRYIFTLPEDSEDHAALVCLLANKEDTEDSDKELESGWVDERNNLCFAIADGQVLRIREDVVATPVPALPFAPDTESPVSLTAFAEDTDLSSLSVEELGELQTIVTEELANRSLEVTGLLDAGCYVAGVDIRPGRYVFSLPAAAKDNATLVYLFDSADDYRNDEEELESGWVDDNENMSFTINDGQALYVREDVVATLVPDLPFDQPETDTTTDTASGTTATEAVSAVLSGGKYVGGKDIKTGRYVLTPAQAGESALVYLYDSMDDCENDENELESGWVNEHEKMSFNITDGQVLVIREDVIATLAPALPFAPSESDSAATEAVSAVLSGGKYVGGEDIKTGWYAFSPAQSGESALVYLYDNMKDCENDENELESGWVNEHSNMSFNIKDGQVLVIREDVVATFDPALPSAQSEADTTTDTTMTEVPSISDPDQILTEITDRVWEITEGGITTLIELKEGGEAVAKETDGSETMEYPAKWTIKDGKLLFLVDTNTFSIAYNEEGGTESLLLYDDSDQLRGIFTPSDKE